MTQIKFKLAPGGRMPTKGHPTDAMWDVYAASRTIENEYITYGLGFSTELPEGWAGQFYPRSSISNTDLVLCNSVGVIDEGYRGEWSARFRPALRLRDFPWERAWMPDHNLDTYNVGDRIGQICFFPLPAYELVEVEELTTTTRGDGGFGSTGNR